MAGTVSPDVFICPRCVFSRRAPCTDGLWQKKWKWFIFLGKRRRFVNHMDTSCRGIAREGNKQLWRNYSEPMPNVGEESQPVWGEKTLKWTKLMGFLRLLSHYSCYIVLDVIHRKMAETNNQNRSFYNLVPLIAKLTLHKRQLASIKTKKLVLANQSANLKDVEKQTKCRYSFQQKQRAPGDFRDVFLRHR